MFMEQLCAVPLAGKLQLFQQWQQRMLILELKLGFFLAGVPLCWPEARQMPSALKWNGCCLLGLMIKQSFLLDTALVKDTGKAPWALHCFKSSSNFKSKCLYTVAFITSMFCRTTWKWCVVMRSVNVKRQSVYTSFVHQGLYLSSGLLI